MVSWYHTYQLSSGMDNNESTIGQHFYLLNIRQKFGPTLSFTKIVRKTRIKIKIWSFTHKGSGSHTSGNIIVRSYIPIKSYKISS